MTAGTLERPSPAARTADVRRVVVRLALGEARRVVRSPLTWLATLVSLWLVWRWVGQTAPILFRDSVNVVGGLMPLAAVALLLGNFATLRERDTDENQLLDSLPNPAIVRTGGLLAAGAVLAWIAVAVEIAAMVFLMVGGPIGQFLWLELASGPVIVWMLWCSGVMLARWAPSAVVAPLMLLVVAFLSLVASPDATLFDGAWNPDYAFEWLAPWTPPSSFGPPEMQLARPVGARMAYLVALLSAMVGLALTRHVALGWRRVAAATVAFVLVALAAVGPALSTSTDRMYDWPGYFDEQPCDLVGGITYCVGPAYRDWIPRWHDTIVATSQLLPIRVERVVQRPNNIGVAEDSGLTYPNLVRATTEWDRTGAEPLRRFVLSANAAFTAVGLPTRAGEWPYAETERQSIRDQNPGMTDAEFGFDFVPERPCAATAQARTVVALWAATEVAGGGIEEPLTAAFGRFGTDGWFVFYSDEQLSSGLGPFEGVLAGMADAALALDVSRLDPNHVSDVIEEHWEEVVDPVTPSTELASWLGLPPPPPTGSDYVTAPCP